MDCGRVKKRDRGCVEKRIVMVKSKGKEGVQLEEEEKNQVHVF